VGVDGVREAFRAGGDLQDDVEALRAGTRPRTDQTIETALAIVRDLALFLTTRRGKSDWALVDVHDIEAFLATNPKSRHRRLTVLRQFFGFARRARLLLVDPTAQLQARQHPAFRGQTLTLQQQRSLFHRWPTAASSTHLHETLVGMLALRHAASSQEVRLLRINISGGANSNRADSGGRYNTAGEQLRG
jgi:site-specific recombinase XerD